MLGDRDQHEVTTSKQSPFGTSHWAGTWNGHPAISLGFHGGATLFYFDNDWQKRSFANLAALHEFLGLHKED